MNPNAAETARLNMIEQQIRPCEVIDERVLAALTKVPREAFVAEAYKGLAFADVHVPLRNDCVMMKPLQEGMMLQSLNVQPGDKVLEVGTGSGFVTACLAELGGQVTSIEIDPSSADQARKTLESLGYCADIRTDDIFSVALHPQAYDAIAVTGSLPTSVDALENLLAPGGRLFCITGDGPVMHATLTTRNADGELHRANLCETALPPLRNAPQPEAFTF